MQKIAKKKSCLTFKSLLAMEKIEAKLLNAIQNHIDFESTSVFVYQSENNNNRCYVFFETNCVAKIDYNKKTIVVSNCESFSDKTMAIINSLLKLCIGNISIYKKDSRWFYCVNGCNELYEDGKKFNIKNF